VFDGGRIFVSKGYGVGAAAFELKAGDPMMERISLAYALNMHAAQGITTDTAM
jgi:hypothetical protein